ncbi:MAG: alkaline phosphatase family protein [Chloroflexi bacterium]|nr:alkaline phosphatase family protein [Chloroflexota bacterium]
MKNQTVLIGLDGATFTILDPLMQDGVMPFLKELIDSGVRAELRSVIPPLTPPAWTSLMTGRNPGQHGIFDFFRKESLDSHHIRFVTSRDVHAETIWSIVDRHGRRATVLNFPLLFPTPLINGYVVPGWMPWWLLRLGCHPVNLYDRLKALPGFNAREFAMDMSPEKKAKTIEGCQQHEYEDWIEPHIRREQQWFQILRALMREDPCELTAVLFDGMDRLQHLCWRLLDPAYLDEPLSPWAQRTRQRCVGYFRQLDQMLAEIVSLAGPEATVVLASDHGFGAQTGTFFVNSWLEQRGYLAWVDDKAPLASVSEVRDIGQLARYVYLLDWERTKAYASTPSSNGIHIVVAGQGGEKGVPEAEYEGFRNKLVEELRGFTTPETGEPVVSQVWTREEVFDGPYINMAPDLILELRDGGLASVLASDAPFKPRHQLSGSHRPEGVFIAAGPGIRQGISLSQLSILDVAPLVLYSWGLPIAADMEGRVPMESFEPSLLQGRPVRADVRLESPPRFPSYTDAGELDAEAEAEVLRRFRALGYVE